MLKSGPSLSRMLAFLGIALFKLQQSRIAYAGPSARQLPYSEVIPGALSNEKL